MIWSAEKKHSVYCSWCQGPVIFQLRVQLLYWTWAWSIVLHPLLHLMWLLQQWVMGKELNWVYSTKRGGNDVPDGTGCLNQSNRSAEAPPTKYKSFLLSLFQLLELEVDVCCVSVTSGTVSISINGKIAGCFGLGFWLWLIPSFFPLIFCRFLFLASSGACSRYSSQLPTLVLQTIVHWLREQTGFPLPIGCIFSMCCCLPRVL